MRNAARSAPAGSATCSPSTRTWTGSPEGDGLGHQGVEVTHAGVGDEQRLPGVVAQHVEEPPHLPRAVRLVASMATSDSLAASGEQSSTIRPLPACTAITLMEWVTMSWSFAGDGQPLGDHRLAGQLLRVRASFDGAFRSAAAASVARRFPSPTSHAVANTATLATTVAGPEPVSATATAIVEVVPASRTAARRRGQRRHGVHRDHDCRSQPDCDKAEGNKHQSGNQHDDEYRFGPATPHRQRCHVEDDQHRADETPGVVAGAEDQAQAQQSQHSRQRSVEDRAPVGTQRLGQPHTFTVPRFSAGAIGSQAYTRRRIGVEIVTALPLTS